MIDANYLLSLGLSVIPITKGAKHPSVNWKEYQQRLATPEEAANWSLPIGIVCGKVSGGLICIDFDDGGSRFVDWMNLVQGNNADLALKLTIQQTPSGGYHVIYRCPNISMGNEKLAKMKEAKNGKVDLIETRGEGGQFLASPSDGYKIIQSSFKSVPTISVEEHNFLISCAKSFNEKFDETVAVPGSDFEVSPFDAYDKTNTPIDLLVKHGWTIEFERDQVVYLKRPGKNERGVSATWNHIPDRFYVFTTNTSFENEHIYKASAVYAVLEHNANWKEAAYALAREGYGKQIQKLMKTVTPVDIADDDIKTFRDLGVDWLKMMNRKSTTRFGFVCLDKAAKQFSPGEVFTLAARSGVGKTTLGMTFLRNICKSEGRKGIMFSLEMSGEMVYQRGGIMFTGKNIDTSDFQDTTEVVMEQMYSSIEMRSELEKEFDNVLVIDKAKVTIETLAHYTERARSKFGDIDLVCIDYLGYINDTSAGSNYEKVSRTAKGIKEFSKLMKTRTILLCQTSREGRDGTEPVKLNHLRDSGAIEESSDYVLGMWGSVAETNRIHCNMLKNRWHSRGSEFDLINNSLHYIEVPVLKEESKEKKKISF